MVTGLGNQTKMDAPDVVASASDSAHARRLRCVPGLESRGALSDQSDHDRIHGRVPSLGPGDLVRRTDLKPLASGCPESFVVLQFLYHPCRKILCVLNGRSVLLSKTTSSDALCLELRDLWRHEYVRSLVADIINAQKPYGRMLPALMKAFEEMNFGEAADIWDAWPDFWEHLITKRLHLALSIIED